MRNADSWHIEMSVYEKVTCVVMTQQQTSMSATSLAGPLNMN